MNTRQMYELAAKAGNVDVNFIDDEKSLRGFRCELDGEFCQWDPAADMVQAFQLAQDCKISIRYEGSSLTMYSLLGLEPRNVKCEPADIASQIIYFAATLGKFLT